MPGVAPYCNLHSFYLNFNVKAIQVSCENLFLDKIGFYLKMYSLKSMPDIFTFNYICLIEA